MNSRYEIIIYWSDVDNAYLAEVPELAGCMADGASYQEALANAQIVIDDWLNIALEINRFIPEPKGRLLYA
jgi:predicted RNase H-like HicB family nuclease